MGYSIAVFGAFNIDSFGDSMFPEALKTELSRRIKVDALLTFAPGEKTEGNGSSYSYDDFEDVVKRIHFDAIIIGGGELLHNHAITFENGHCIYPEGEIWKKPVKYGMKYQIPVLINAVGMPYEFKVEEKEELTELFQTVKYLSFRDSFSIQRWNDYFGINEKAVLTPDSLWLMNKYFSRDILEKRRDELKKRYGIAEKYIVFQYGTTKEYQETADVLKKFCKEKGVQLLAVAVNACHEDLYVVEHLDDEEGEFVSISERLSNEEIVTIISGAEMFVGTSLHGNLTAAAFRVKNVILDMYPEFVNKLDGLSDMLQYTGNFVNEFENLRYVLEREYAREETYPEEVIRKVQQETEKHYDQLATVIEKKYFAEETELKCRLTEDCGVLFRKGYFKVSNSREIKSIHKYIAKQKDKYFIFKLREGNVKKQDRIEFMTPVAGPICVKAENEENLIREKNCLNGYTYIDPVVRWVLNERADLYCTFEEISVIGREEEVLQAYKNKLMHIEQLLIKERIYQNQLSHLEVQEKEYKEQLLKERKRLETITAEYEKKNNELDALHKKEIVTLQDAGKKEMAALQDAYETKILHLKTEYEKNTKKMEEKISSDRQEIIELKQEVLNKEGHVQLLLPAERERDAIVQSKMFKLMRFVCRSYDIVMIGPRFIGRNIAAFCRMMTHVNWQELKIAAGYVKREGFFGAYHHLMRDYHQGEIKQIQVEVEDKIFDEITDIDACEKIEFPLVENPTVSIVIPAYNQFTYTYYCLKSILENSGDISYEVILADDCSTDITREIHKAVKNLIVARTEKNMLFLRNCNHAAKKAKGKYILFLNNDTQVQKDWLKPLVDLCERDATVGITGSKLVYADGTLQEAGGIIWKDASGWNYGRNTDAMLPEYNYVRDVDYISGASIMIRRSLWEELGGFDEYFAPAYYEDSDLAFQVRKAGYRVVYQPLSVVVHFEGKSNGTDLNSGVKKNQVENQMKFRDKWKEVLNKENLPNGQEVYLAKDRSQLKKRILVVDHYVPHYDNDAGGRCTYMYLKLFLKLGMKVTFIGDNFYPHEPYTTELTQMGIEILYGNYYCTNWQEWLKENLHYFDYVYLQRPHIAIKYIDIVKQYGKGKVFYFAHDLHFLRLTREYELTKDKKYLEEAEHFRKDEFYLFDKADVVHVVGSYEQAVLQKELPNKAIRNIPLYIYEELLSDINKDFTTRNDIIFVGGFGHPPNVDAVLWFAKEVFPGIVEKYPDIVWHIVGSKAPKEVQELAGKNIVLEGFVSDEDLDKMYRRCRLAVVPLRVGAGVKGKVVEAAYYQIPLVTTSIGEEGISNKEGAFIAEDDAKKMTELIINLYTDYEKLREMSDGGIELIRNHYMLSEAERVLTQDL